MSAAKTRVLVVDDSAFMRKALSMMLESDPHIEVVGNARNGKEGVELVKKLKPDLVTMDVEMPEMDGLTALRIIMEENPTPVMMVSSITQKGASATFEAMDLGAVDFIPKELSFISLDIVHIKNELLEKIKTIGQRRALLMAAAKRRIASKRISAEAKAAMAVGKSRPRAIRRKHLVGTNIQMVALGCSTGGPPALQAVVTGLPKNFPVPVLVVQHMPPKFTKSLADRLNGLSKVTVSEARQGEIAEPGHVYIAPGAMHMTLSPGTVTPSIRVAETPNDTLYRPSVDVMMKSVIKRYGKQTLGVILTGMGNDGQSACQELHGLGGKIIAQDEETCIVYGMPRAIVEKGLADTVSPIESITDEILSFF